MSLRSVITGLLVISAIFGLAIAAICVQRRRIRGAVEFAAFVAACSFYAGGYAGELWAGNLEAILVWIRIEYVGIAFIPSTWLIFVSRYTGKRLPPWLRAASLAFSALTFAIVMSLGRHGLFYVDPRLDLSGPFPTLAFDRGPWYLAFAAFNWGLLLAGEALLLRFLLRAGSFFRAQAGIAFFGALLPFAAYSAYLLGLVPDHIDPSPMTFPAFSIPLSVSLLRFRFLDVMPVARDRVFEAISDGVVVVDAEGRLLDSNPAARAMIAVGPDKLGLSLEEAAGADYGLSRLVGTTDTFEFSPREGESVIRARACPVGEGPALGTVILLTDVTETRHLVRRLDELASTDSLTGLSNRRGFDEAAHRLFDQARRGQRFVSLCILDLDHFKAVNDGQGHEAGDAVLAEVARRLGERLRASDLLCRWGGEEFAIVFADCDEAASVAAAERLRERLRAAPVPSGAAPIPVTASFGLACGVPQAGDDLETWMRRADAAMYDAKDAGRDRVVLWRPCPDA